MMAPMSCHTFQHPVLSYRCQPIQRLPLIHRSSGFSLVEVLVSIVVLSFGLLGMVGMQAASLQANREARLQSSAVVLARELAEMIRGNKEVGVRTSSNPYLGTFSNPAGSTPLVPATPEYCMSVGATACSDTTKIGTAELTEWLARVDSELPGAKVSICLDSAPFDSSGVPQWACTAGAGSPIVIKIGWTKGSTNRSNTGSAAFERATVPSMVLPVTPGNTA
jgi:type IV pilus assembly protein PilV